jgi:hypothetical protein
LNGGRVRPLRFAAMLVLIIFKVYTSSGWD